MTEKDWAALWLLPTVVIATPIYATDYLTAKQAQQLLFPQVDNFIAQPVKLDSDLKSKIKELSGVRQRWDIQDVWRVEKSGQLLGWFIVDNVVGKHEFITYAAAISPDGHVIGIEIMSYRETHGDEVREVSWREQFKDKTLADPFKLNKDVMNVSGATLSCRNVLDGVKRLLVIHKLILANE